VTGDAGALDRGAVRSPASRALAMLRLLATLPIVIYSRFVSPALPRRCRYEPTCSSYALQAVRRHGVARGFVLAGWRLLRCNPFSDGGFDPVEAQRLFRGRAASTDGECCGHARGAGR
jgi:uncharacterized protein